MGLGGERAHQLAALAARQRRIGDLADQHVPEQANLPGPVQPGLLLVLGLRHFADGTSSKSPGDNDPRTLADQARPPTGATGVGRPHGQDGANNLPPEAADAASHGDTAPSTGHRAATAPAAPTIAATASPTSDLAGAGITGSGPHSANSTVNTTRTASARSANRRSQPRTVSCGRPSQPAIARTPVPLAFAASAAPITSARSARRARPNTGNNTCVTPHPAHLDRRGRTRTSCLPTPRSTRATAQPQGASRCRHPGHSRSPAASRRSTEPGSASTVSTAPPSATTALPALGQEITGRACAYPSSARCRPKRPDTTRPTPACPHQHSQRRSTHHSSASSETPNTRHQPAASYSSAYSGEG
jgi:hypothetical protein